MKKNILIIGAGIHGCFLTKYLSKFNVNIFLIEKKMIFALKLLALHITERIEDFTIQDLIEQHLNVKLHMNILKKITNHI